MVASRLHTGSDKTIIITDDAGAVLKCGGEAIGRLRRIALAGVMGGV